MDGGSDVDPLDKVIADFVVERDAARRHAQVLQTSGNLVVNGMRNALTSICHEYNLKLASQGVSLGNVQSQFGDQGGEGSWTAVSLLGQRNFQARELASLKLVLMKSGEISVRVGGRVESHLLFSHFFDGQNLIQKTLRDLLAELVSVGLRVA